MFITKNSCKESIQNNTSFVIILKLRNIVWGTYPFFLEKRLIRALTENKTKLTHIVPFNKQTSSFQHMKSLLSRSLLFPTQGSKGSLGQSNHDSSTQPLCTRQQPLLITITLQNNRLVHICRLCSALNILRKDNKSDDI